MFKKLKSLFKKKEEVKEDSLEDIKRLHQTIGNHMVPLLTKYLRHNRSIPTGITKEDWRHVTESILYSFSALQSDVGYINRSKNKKHREKIKKGLILFAHHVDKFVM